MPRPQDPRAKIELLRAAEAVFAEQGLDRARVEDITARAGRSKGSFYLHFATKEEAFRQIVESLMARLAACIADDPPSFEGLSRCQASQFWLEKDCEVLEFLWQNRGTVRLLLSGGGSAAFGYLIDEFAERSRENIKRFLTWGIDAGLYRDDFDVEIASLSIAGAYDRVARHLVKQPRRPDIMHLATQLQRFVLAGVSKHDPRPEGDRPVSVADGSAPQSPPSPSPSHPSPLSPTPLPTEHP